MNRGDMFADLPVFVAAVEAGGFAAAAAKLNLTRSAVGRTVARLERRLGVRLFHRTTRTLVLTDDGQAFFEHCRRALDEVHAVTAQLESLADAPRSPARWQDARYPRDRPPSCRPPPRDRWRRGSFGGFELPLAPGGEGIAQGPPQVGREGARRN